MGDSITAGNAVPGGYRRPLLEQLSAWGLAVDYVGSQRQEDDPTADGDHWGRSGRGIADTDEELNGRSYVSLQANEGANGAVREGLFDDLGQAISRRHFSVDPDDGNLLLLLLGTNDVLHQVVEERDGARAAGDRNNDGRGEQQDRIAESTFRRLRDFLGEVNERAAEEGLRLDVVLSTIPDIRERWNDAELRDPISGLMREELRDYNDLIRDRLDGRRASHITITVVDGFDAVGDDLADGIHPSAKGQRRLAEAWAEGIGEVLARTPSEPGALVKGSTYALPFRDFDGNVHGLGNYDGAVDTSWGYLYQGAVDINGDGSPEHVFSNRTTARWATAAVDPITGRFDFADHGPDGATRVVGTYLDPLVAEGEANGGVLLSGEPAPRRGGAFDSQRRLQEDLVQGNLSLRIAADADGDGGQEVYWRLNDGSAYLRMLMHADGNIRYANYRSEDELRELLAAQGQAPLLQQILA